MSLPPVMLMLQMLFSGSVTGFTGCCKQVVCCALLLVLLVLLVFIGNSEPVIATAAVADASGSGGGGGDGCFLCLRGDSIEVSQWRIIECG